MSDDRTVFFSIDGVLFQYSEKKNQININKHGISFETAALVFFDYDRIEMFDTENSIDEERYDTIGKITLPRAQNNVSGRGGRKIGWLDDDLLFVVYTERVYTETDGAVRETIRLISARMATGFERGLYYGKQY